MTTAFNPNHPLVGVRVLNVHRQSCDYPPSYRTTHHGVVTRVEGCLVRVLFDGRDYDCWMAPQDLARVDLWPRDGARISL